jgi:spore germination protein YaaH
VVFFGLQINSGDGAIVKTNAAWTVWTSQTLRDFVNAAHAAGTRVLVSIDLHDFSTSPTNLVCQGLGAANAQNTINESITQMKNAGIDGINIDYEGTITTCNDGMTNRALLLAFTKNMRAQMPAGTLLYIDTFSGSAEDNLEFFDITGLGPYVDAMFVMAYDMDFANATEPPLNCPAYCFNPTSPLNTYRFNVTKTIQQYTARVAPSKVILGQPYYGSRGCVNTLTDAHQLLNRDFVNTTYRFASTVSTQTGVAYFAGHRDPSDGVSEWDTWYDSDWKCNREQYFDDVVSLGAKYDLVNSTKLRGVGVFTLDYGGGSPELWNSFAAHFTCPGYSFFAGDFVGHAKSDLLSLGGAGSCVLASTGTSLSTPAPWSSVPFYGNIATLVGDVNGDGKADLVAVNNNNTFVMTSTGTSFNPPAAWSTTPFYGTRGTFLADVAGTGKAALVAVNDTSTWVMLSTGTGFGSPQLWSSTPFFGNVGTFVADVTGTGKASLIALNNNNAFVMTSTGTGFNAPAAWSTTPFYGQITTMVTDVTGTGKAALVALNYTSTWVMTSSGTGFSAPALWSSQPFYGQIANLVADVNGDKKGDVIAINWQSVWAMTSTGTAFAAPANWYLGPP